MALSKKRKHLVADVLEDLELKLLMFKILHRKYETDMKLLTYHLNSKRDSESLVLEVLKSRRIKLHDVKLAIYDLKQNVIYFKKLLN